MKVVYDLETYVNIFTFAGSLVDAPFSFLFEVSDWKDDTQAILDFLLFLKMNDAEMIGFNNNGFDYPVLHYFWQHGKPTAADLCREANRLIRATKEERFANTIWPSNRLVRQLDLFKIHHFDNKAKMTSLKAVEFNLRMDSVEDLPFTPNTSLTKDEAAVLRKYNLHDVQATKEFYFASLPAIRLREDLSKEYGKDFTNHNDVKIGKEIFQLRLEAQGYECYEYGPDGRTPKQTKRSEIALERCVPPYVMFSDPGFARIQHHFLSTTISETKGAFENLSATVHGLDYIFGTGGLHASVTDKVFSSSRERIIIDADVTSMYPSIAIVNEYYPEHIGPGFIGIYKGIKEERLRHKKGTAPNAALKLALNGTFGATNDMYSIFYDPLMTMQITITGQLSLAMLVDKLIDIKSLQVIQANTDGVTCILDREDLELYNQICKNWERMTGLDLEFVEYDRMFIADVNNYLAVDINGKVKRKGRYEYKAQWHQNASRLVVPKVTEKVLLENAPIRETVENWAEKMDFMSRVKVNRSSKLLGEIDGAEYTLPNLCRYYIAKNGVKLTKLMPPLKKNPTKWRRIGVESGWRVCVCNNIRDAVMPVDFDYYINEIEKLVLPFTEG